ncbi:hypothetical protein [Streptomyces sp. NPDC048411]|uniref:hypothetical protein n=1 Tax=Streptomyces sp. NPDC048411 TaxID=3157206 RepID=UPI00345551C3
MPGVARQAGLSKHALVLLLLAVLTVVGGASAAVAAAGAVTPPRSLSGPSPAAAHTAVVPPSAQHTDRTARPGHPHDTRQIRTAPATGHERTVLPAVPRPWVATDHIRIQHQLPPPVPGGALLPGTPGILVPLLARQWAPDTPSFAADPLRVALPGVRGPPRTDRFPGHRSARQT